MLRNATSSMNDWLRLGICLALSAGLHAAIGATSWSPGDAAPVAAAPLTIALVEVVAGRDESRPYGSVADAALRPASQPQPPVTGFSAPSPESPAPGSHQLPRYAANPLPDYPRLARQNRWEGTVRLRARISPAGTVEEVGLEQSSGYPLLDRAALAGVRRWRFSPASRNGVPVPCDVSIPVAFRLEEGRGNP